MQSRSTSPCRAFTIVELLVVISIITLLIALVLPALARAKRSARDAGCVANLKQIGYAMEMYVGDNRGHYPRALPVLGDTDDEQNWQQPWPPDVCPQFWQMGYPAILLSYLGHNVVDPYDYFGLVDPTSPSYIPEELQNLFDCPLNTIPREEVASRKCNYPLDYGLSNWASQSRQTDVAIRRYLAGDQTWGLSYVADSGGPNDEDELDGWWVPFVHPGDAANLLLADQSIDRVARDEFIKKYASDPPESEL